MSSDDTEHVQSIQMPERNWRHHVSMAWLTRLRASPHVSKQVIGVILVLTTVVLWTLSNFLASTIFADHSYSKPFLVTYVNTAFFMMFLLVQPLKRACYPRYTAVEPLSAGVLEEDSEATGTGGSASLDLNESDAMMLGKGSWSQRLEAAFRGMTRHFESNRTCTVQQTAQLSLEFCALWFGANYFIALSLEYTTVASSTILTSTSGLWTLMFGAMAKVEVFNIKKLIGVLTSLVGVVLVSSVDLSGSTDETRGRFPHKTTGELAAGNIVALASAVIYGFYSVLMKKRIGNVDDVDMLLFFGFVGLFNTLLFWPGLIILHIIGIEPFQLPPTSSILMIVLFNSLTSLISDFCWAYATVLTSPLLVTVGISLSIPLSLIGEILVNGQTTGLAYWLGAVLVVMAFIFINYQHEKDEEAVSPSGPEYEALQPASEDPRDGQG